MTTAAKPRAKKPQATRQGPIRVADNVSYYERRDYIEIQLTNIMGQIVIRRIPWADLLASAKRCRPEEFSKP